MGVAFHKKAYNVRADSCNATKLCGLVGNGARKTVRFGEGASLSGSLDPPGPPGGTGFTWVIAMDRVQLATKLGELKQNQKESH